MNKQCTPPRGCALNPFMPAPPPPPPPPPRSREESVERGERVPPGQQPEKISNEEVP